MRGCVATGTSGTIGKYLSKSIKAIDKDVRSSSEFFDLEIGIKDKNFIHLAGVVGNQKVIADRANSYAVNVEATIKIAEEYLMKSNGKFVFVSSSHVYGKSEERLSENSYLDPINVYGKQKLEAEIGLLDVFKNTPNRLCIVRVFSILDWDSQAGTLGSAIADLKEDATSQSLKNCDDVRDFLTPETVARTLMYITDDERVFGTINLCSSQGISVGTAAKRMLSENGFSYKESQFLQGNSITPTIVGDNEKLKYFFPNLSLSWSPSQFHSK